MAVKALLRDASSAQLKTGLILLDSCNPEQRCNETVRVVASKNGQKDCCTTAFWVKKVQFQSRPTSTPLKNGFGAIAHVPLLRGDRGQVPINHCVLGRDSLSQQAIAD